MSDFYGGDAGPLFAQAQENDALFAASKIAPTGQERVIAGIIARRLGRANPISNADLQKAAGMSERKVKDVVEQLVVAHHLRIGAVRVGDRTGYYMIQDAEDLAAAVGPYRAQILAMWRRLRVLQEPRELRELLGQLRVDEKTDAEAQSRGGE